LVQLVQNRTIIDFERVNLVQLVQFFCSSFTYLYIILRETPKCFESKGIKVGVIIAETKDKVREKYINDLRIGQLDGLISIEILTAGFDEPLISCVIFATATKSWKKYIQCAGRGIRLMGLNISESIAFLIM